MKYSNPFEMVSDILEKTEVSAVLIDGFAVNHYQFSRATGDIDFLSSGKKEIGCDGSFSFEINLFYSV